MSLNGRASETLVKKSLRILYLPYKWFVFYPMLVLTTFICASSAVLISVLTTPKIAGICGVWWARLNSFFTPMRVRINGKENIDNDRSYVIISNHQSQYDIFVLYGWLGMDFRWVMKQELRKVPGIGISCEKIGHIFIDRSNRKEAIRSLNEAKGKIRAGTSVLFFPEGTRSRSGALLRFKKGAFRFAIDLQLPILPVTITGTKNILPTNTRQLFPGTSRMTIHPAIEIHEYHSGNIQDLMDRTREMIELDLDKCDQT